MIEVKEKLEELETNLQTTIEEVQSLQNTVAKLTEVLGLNPAQKEDKPE